MQQWPRKAPMILIRQCGGINNKAWPQYIITAPNTLLLKREKFALLLPADSLIAITGNGIKAHADCRWF